MFKTTILIVAIIIAGRFTYQLFKKPIDRVDELIPMLDKNAVPIMNIFEYNWNKYAMSMSYISAFLYLAPFYVIHMIFGIKTPFFITITYSIFLLIMLEGYILYKRIMKFQFVSSKHEFAEAYTELGARLDMRVFKILQGCLGVLIILISVFNLIFFNN